MSVKRIVYFVKIDKTLIPFLLLYKYNNIEGIFYELLYKYKD